MDVLTKKIFKSRDFKSKVLNNAITGVSFIDSLDLEDLKSRRDILVESPFRRAFKQRFAALSQIESLAKTERILASRTKRINAKMQRRLEQRGAVVKTESAVLGDMTIGSADNTETHENVTDHSGESSDSVKMGSAPTDTSEGSKEMHTLEDFFKRPVAIYDSTWNSGTHYDVKLDVWDLWSLDPSVRAKLSNYSYFKANLKVKISVSGTPFHYGMLMLSYQPYALYNNTLTAYDSIMASTTPGASADVLACYHGYLSQAPHTTYIDVKTNEPTILEIPFISHKQMYRLYNEASTVIDNNTSFVDLAEAGELRLVTLNPFEIANDDYDTHVSLNVYAWVENIELGCITGTNVDITAESKEIYTEGRKTKHGAVRQVRKDLNALEESIDEDEEPSWEQEEDVRQKNWQASMSDKPMYSGEGSFGSRLMKSLEKGGDEYTTPGPVSAVATAVSNVGNSLKDIPYIGGFAKATSTVAKSVGKVASWFGWAKPAVLEKPVFVKNQPFANGANLSNSETTFRITCDPKQELTVDQKIGGVDGPDDMAIMTIASRESFFTSFTWTDTDIAMDTVIWRGGITPQYFNFAALANGVTRLAQPTACAFATAPFYYWRGTVKLRFEIVCSKFHRGKLLFKYEPNVSQAVLISTNDTKLNQQNTVIVDIQDTQNLCFEFDWAYPRAWAQVDSNVADGTVKGDTNFATFDHTNAIPSYMNGFMEVRPLNELIQPTASANISVNVYISCSDLQVAHPASQNLLGGVDDLHRRYNYTESAEVTSETINPTGSSLEGIHSYHFGEKILSFRSLLKRYQSIAYVKDTTTIDGRNIWSLVGNSLPWQASAVKRGTLASEPSGPGHIRSSLYNYLRPAYMGVRGGMRYRILPYTHSNIGPGDYVRVKMRPQDDIGTDALALAFGGVTSNSEVENCYSTLDGTVNFHPSSNGGIEFEIPYYHDGLFVFAFDEQYGANLATDLATGYSTYTNSSWEVNFMTYVGNLTGAFSNRGITAFLVDAATAEDFTFLRFQGSPFVTT